MANPPMLPSANQAPAGVDQSDWEKWFGDILHGINPGGVFSGGPPAGNAPAGQGATIPKSQADPAVQAGLNAPKSGGGSLLSQEFWHRIILDLEVYGFLFLLVGIGLYGLFAPQINTAVGAAGTVIAPEVAGPKEVGRRVGHAIRKRVRK